MQQQKYGFQCKYSVDRLGRPKFNCQKKEKKNKENYF